MALKWILVLLLTTPVLAQTSITATITDSDSQTWNNGTWTASLVSPSGPPQGCTTPTTVAGIMNGSGTLTGSLCDNSLVGPSGSYWRFTLCPNASATCSQVSIAVTGATENLSTPLSAGVTAPRFAASFGAYGYADVEVTPKPPPGATYYNVTTPAFRQWSGTAWTNIGGGGSSGFPITLGSTSIGASSTTTSVAGFTVNGVFLNSAGSTSLFLNQAGGYTTPSGGGCTAAGAIGTLQSSDGSGGCDATSLVFAGSVLTNTGATGGVGYTASVTGASGAGEYTFSVDGSNIFGLLNWGTGNGDGLSGVAGFFDSTNSLMVWNTNSTDDLFFGTPLSGGNVAAGTGSVASILHTGAAKFTTVNGVSLSSTGSTTLFLNQAGGYTAPSGGGAVSSVSNSDGTLTLSPTTGAVVASLALSHANTWTATQTFSNIIDSALTAGFLPIAGSPFANSHIDDGVTNSGELTFSEPGVFTGSTHGITIPSGTAVSGVAGSVIYASDATSGFAEVNENNTGLSRVCTASNGICAPSGSSAFSAITSATNTTAAMLVGAGASLNFTSTGTINASTLLAGTWAIPGAIGGTTPNAGTFTTVFTGRVTNSATGNTVYTGTNPTITSGFNTSGSSIGANGTAAFTVTVGTGTATSVGVVAMPSASVNWNCMTNNVTAANGARTDNTRVTARTTTSVTVTNSLLSTGVATNFTNGDQIDFVCMAR